MEASVAATAFYIVLILGLQPALLRLSLWARHMFQHSKFMLHYEPQLALLHRYQLMRLQLHTGKQFSNSITLIC